MTPDTKARWEVTEHAALTEQVAHLTEVVDFLRRQNKADHDALSALRRSAEGKVLRLTEQVAQLTRERDRARNNAEIWRTSYEDKRAEVNAADAAKSELRLKLERSQVLRSADIKRANEAEQDMLAAESEVARLTEALAAERRATGAEADIEEGRDTLEAARAIRSELVQVHDELLAAERDRDAANALLRRIYDWQGPHGFTVTVMNDIKAHLSGQPAAPAPAAADARVRELEAHNASLRERNTELVHMRQVAEARVRELEVFKEAHSEARRGYAERVAGLESELAALRERVARALAACGNTLLGAGDLAEQVEEALRA